MLVGTKEVSKATGLSMYELRRGFKEGIYPALEVGRGDRRRFLRWDLEVLQEALRAKMTASEPDSGR